MDRIEKTLAGFDRAKSRRAVWEAHWQECYDYTLPQKSSNETGGGKKYQNIYDGTAPDAVDQLAASLLSQLTPPWSGWIGLTAGSDLSDAETEAIAPILKKASNVMAAHFDRSNFAVEMHQCFLDMVVSGTASLLFEEGEIGAHSAFKFTAVPVVSVYMDESPSGRLDITYRLSNMRYDALTARFPMAQLPTSVQMQGEKDKATKFKVLESVAPFENSFVYVAILCEEGQGYGGATVLHQDVLDDTPFINFRWMKSAGETYGRSPVMKALPDIKTANKVVELILKNASIAVSGIWQADDDGVLNPANIQLVPGAIIPKAVGSSGLKALEMPGNFNVSQLVLDDLRSRIRHALLNDQLAAIDNRTMTATEVLSRSAEMARVLGATYGRMQSELITPLALRAFNILKKRGEIPDINLDGRTVMLDYRSPLARAQAQRDVQNTLYWLNSVGSLGAEAESAVNKPEAARWMGRSLGVPVELIRSEIGPVIGTSLIPLQQEGIEQ